MFLFFALLAALLVGGVVGLLITTDPGYVLINYGNHVVETSVWVGLAFLVVGYVLIRLIIGSWRYVAYGQSRMLRWRSGRRARQGRKQTVRGLMLMAEGRWAEARKVLVGSADDVDTPLINYLNGARAAHELGDAAERDQLLKSAHETTPGAKFAALLTQAEFRMRDGDHEHALATLLSLRKRAPKHTTVLARLALCYEALGDWAALQQHLKEVSDRKAMPETEIRRLVRLVWEDKLKGEESVGRLWSDLPKHLKADVDLLVGWVDALHESGRDDDAVEVLRLVLNQTWDDALVERYGRYLTADPARQLVAAKGWAKERPNDGALALALGRLSLANEEFDEGRSYFEAALRLAPSDEVYSELGRLCVAIGDERRGTDYLMRSLGDLPVLPLPTVKDANNP